ncbi:MAG: tetratricopeptide (TPR) repeat protein, partial [bacterium]
DYTVEAVTFWPYKSVRGNLSLEMKLTGLNPTNIVAVTFDSRQFAHKLGGKPASLAEQIAAISTAAGTALSKSDEKGDKKNKLEDSDLVLPNFTQIVSDMAESIAAKFVRRIAVTQQRVAYSIASGGDATAKLLIEAGAYKTAIKMLNKNAKKKAADLYNLGLCYEAIGEFGVAKIHYEDALGKAKKNLMFAQGVGRIERLKRESRIVREQLASKK